MTSYENIGSIIGESNCSITIHDTEDVFNSNFAIFSRGRSRRNFLIITFPQSKISASIPLQKHKDILQYIVSLTSEDDAKQGFVLIFDRRNDYWSTVCSNLTITIENFPSNIQKIYVLQPTSFIQRNRIDPSLKFLNDDHKYKVLLLNSVEELHYHVDADQLTSHLNGTLFYDHQDWICKQKIFENLSFEIASLTQKLKKICQFKQENDFPNSSGETEQLLIDHELMRADAEEQFDSLNNKVAAIYYGKEANADSPKYQIEHVNISERLADIITKAKKSFKGFCSKYRLRLEHCLQLRKFEEEFKQIQFLMAKYNKYLSEICVNSDLSKSEINDNQLQTFQESSKVDVNQAKELLKCGLEFIQEEIYAVDCIKPKCYELEKMIETYDQLLDSKSKLSKNSLKILTLLENVNKFCMEGVDLLAHQSVEDYKSNAATNVSIDTIENFLSKAETVDLIFISKNMNCFADEDHYDFKKSSEQLLSKFLDVKKMCLKRKESLLNSINKKIRPIQLVVPEISSINTTSDELITKNNIPEIPNITISKPEFTPIKKKDTIRHKNSSSDYILIKPMVGGQLNNETNQAPVEQKRRIIINSLRESEISYLSQLSKLKNLIDNKEYSNQLLQRTISDTVAKIHTFHSSILSRVLLSLYQIPSLIGEKFLELEEQFKIYQIYINQINLYEKYKQNENCTVLLTEDEIKLLNVPRERLDHFYKSIIEFSKICNEKIVLTDLKSAQKMFANILNIEVEFDCTEPNFVEERKLILQGLFQMHIEQSKKDSIKDFMSKYKPRHLFLYNDQLVVCKKVANDYLPQVSLQLSSIGITENVKSDKRKFEIWLNSRDKVYSFQAQNVSDKETWITELNKILFNQFHQIKSLKQTRDAN